MKQYIVITHISDDDGNSYVVSASVEAKTKQSAIKKASECNGYDPDDEYSVNICAIYEIAGSAKITLV